MCYSSFLLILPTPCKDAASINLPIVENRLLVQTNVCRIISCQTLVARLCNNIQQCKPTSVVRQVVQLVRRPHCTNCHVVSNHPVALNRHFITNRHVVLNQPFQRPHPSSFWARASSLKARTAVVVPGWSLSVPGLSLGL